MFVKTRLSRGYDLLNFKYKQWPLFYKKTCNSSPTSYKTAFYEGLCRLCWPDHDLDRRRDHISNYRLIIPRFDRCCRLGLFSIYNYIKTHT